MDNFGDEAYRKMLADFRVSDLQTLLEAFGKDKEGQRTELREQALEMLNSRPIGLNYVAYVTKILEIHNKIMDTCPILQRQIMPMTPQHSDSIPSSPRIEVINNKFNKIPFCNLLEVVIKPTLLIGIEKHTGMNECMFMYTLSTDQANIISGSRDTSFEKRDYPCQLQIRIGKLTNVCDELTDYWPKGLHIEVNNRVCPLPPTAPQTKSRTEPTQIYSPINCAQISKITPLFLNKISINWIPDGENYVLALYLVRYFNVYDFMKKLEGKKSWSITETKQYIVKKLTNFNPDFATTSFRISLVCPLSKVRMKIPVKSVYCQHVQCFDVKTFILIHEKKKWLKCPVCDGNCMFDNLKIDNYFLQIIVTLTHLDDIKEVEVLGDGSWILIDANKEAKNVKYITENKVKSVKDVYDLYDSDDEQSIESKEKPKPGSSKCQESENLKPYFIDLTKDEDEIPSKQKD